LKISKSEALKNCFLLIAIPLISLYQWSEGPIFSILHNQVPEAQGREKLKFYKWEKKVGEIFVSSKVLIFFFKEKY